MARCRTSGHSIASCAAHFCDLKASLASSIAESGSSRGFAVAESDWGELKPGFFLRLKPTNKAYGSAEHHGISIRKSVMVDLLLQPLLVENSCVALRKNWYATEALPIFAVVGVAVGGCGWYLVRLARGPDVVWNRHGNPG